MENFYPKGPDSVPENLTKPTSKYKLHAWLALAGLGTFVLLYFGLIYWFASSSIKFFVNISSGNGFFNFIAGVVMGFLALFMVKALFFIKRFQKTDDFEISREEEPELFKFINEVADNAGAPRPHRVYLSPRVNAAVFYDLSIINLIFPTKKNLEIGLGLVNSLSLNEFKAVLAHEFGHFAQKTMAVGRYVYISRQIASHMIGTRDWFDNFLRGLSSVDLRVAWIGWLLSILVWAIRSLMDTLFTIVILAERALSREMEFNADLVAVSLTGSDAIVNGLYKLEAADNAWDQSVQYGYEALLDGKAVSDVFYLQKYFVEKIGIILDKPEYGHPPVLENSSTQRIFKKNLASPPKMWSTHPSGFEREENAKRVYIKAPQDDRSSWIVFKNPEEMKQKMTKHLYSQVDLKEKTAEVISNEQAVSELDKRYSKIFYDPKYRGYYLKHPLTRDVSLPADLYTTAIKDEEIAAHLKQLYPESLKQELEMYESRNEEIVMLQALFDKLWDAPNGVIHHEGKEIKRKDLPLLISNLKNEVKNQQQKFLEYNRKVRSLHLKIAEKFDPSWTSYLKGLTVLIHYTEHSIAWVTDRKMVFDNTLRLVLADRKVSSDEMSRLLSHANEVARTLEGIYTNTANVHPDTKVLEGMQAENWSSQLEEFKLGYAGESNIQSWIEAVDSWINLAVDRLEKMRQAALEELIRSEEKLSASYLSSGNPGIAPGPSKISYDYPILLNGNESSLEHKLGLWERFYIADGLIPSVARLAVAASIIGAALFAGHTINKKDLMIYNGLSIPVTATIAGESIQIAAYSHEKISVATDAILPIETKTENGALIEKFDTDVNVYGKTYVYNIGSAAMMQELTIYYTTMESKSTPDAKSQSFGTPRWFASDADFFFTDPPKTIEMTGYVDERNVLIGYAKDPATLLSQLKLKSDSVNVIRTHVLWDDAKSANLMEWLSVASLLENGDSLIASRLTKNKNEVITLRALQDQPSETGRKKACRECEERYAKDPENADLYYLAKRCMEDGPEQDRAFIEGHRKWPENPWLSFAGGFAYTAQDNWVEAEKAITDAIMREPALSSACVDLARIYKMNHNTMIPNTYNSEFLNYLIQFETGSLTDTVSLMYWQLYSGNLEDAMNICGNHESRYPYLLRIAAASDGASEDMIKQCTRLKPEEGINMSTLVSTIGLMARQGKDLSPYKISLKNLFVQDYAKFEALINTLQSGGSPEKAEEIIKSLSVHTKGYAYVLGAVYYGKQSPPSWKEKASRLLFISERPYFKI